MAAGASAEGTTVAGILLVCFEVFFVDSSNVVGALEGTGRVRVSSWIHTIRGYGSYHGIRCDDELM